ncbi:MAG: hypothetical protein ABEJ44_04425 [Halanaeroarchaeum sp.]
MATTGRTAADSDADALAETLREASHVHLVSHADGDALAATGLLTAALGPETNFQISTVRTRADADRRVDASAATTVVLGIEATDADATVRSGSIALATYDAAGALGGGETAHAPDDGDAARTRDDDPALALAGAVAAGVTPTGTALEDATEAGIERRPGVGIPTADVGDGLAHSTLFHADVSGDESAAGALLAELDLPAEMDDEARRRVASAIALSATEPPAPPRAADAIERPLRPYVLPDGPFETVEGYADVLEALARTDPGVAAALSLGLVDRTTALEAWREHAIEVHEALRLADRDRRSGIVALETGRADPWTTARLVRDFRSGEPSALVVGDGAALATTETDAKERLEEVDAVESVGGRSTLAFGSTDGDTNDLLDELEGTA